MEQFSANCLLTMTITSISWLVCVKANWDGRCIVQVLCQCVVAISYLATQNNFARGLARAPFFAPSSKEDRGSGGLSCCRTMVFFSSLDTPPPLANTIPSSCSGCLLKEPASPSQTGAPIPFLNALCYPHDTVLHCYCSIYQKNIIVPPFWY